MRLMRTTLDLDDDVLAVARSMASHQRVSLGKAVSLLMLKGIGPSAQSTEVRNGLRVISRPAGATPVTLDIINQLREE
jgi:hypothetical protein